MSTRRASRYSSVVWPLCIELHRDDSSGDVSDEHRDEEGRDLPDSALAVDVVLLLEALEATDAAADDHANAVRVQAVGSVAESCVVHRLACAGNRVLGVVVGPLRLFSVHEIEGVEALHLRREPDRKVRGVELGDWSRA